MNAPFAAILGAKIQATSLRACHNADLLEIDQFRPLFVAHQGGQQSRCTQPADIANQRPRGFDPAAGA